ncbi:HlyD family efflux transporter periplasmic adaptor subunit [Crateriforma conspicua]|uniref:Branched-chain alpha-keto acid dehydrogenase subunit E2 n=1 Tax=Crateriforma conspicua TaxID=2527996 RepID=A0A5C5Y288_9PLAN|nr:HlyD family efflux transporter periplasmic adaptor subunit [Crateriforma conspicua]QDV64345.1 branched-chain alpha-keto acid dehydrogenase subunit E2 [Crateriforma conspicua]TWT69747.1 branched-chain alpha-keto acid dehydrogenase subunit E2 [Crateriforma conspicua]
MIRLAMNVRPASLPITSVCFWMLFASVVVGGQGEGDRVNRIDVQASQCVVRYGTEIDLPALSDGAVTQWAVGRNQVVVENQVIVTLTNDRLTRQRQTAIERLRLARTQAEDTTTLDHAEAAMAAAKEELRRYRNRFGEPDSLANPAFRALTQVVSQAQRQYDQALAEHNAAEQLWRIRESELAEIDTDCLALQLRSPIDGILVDVYRDGGEWAERGQPIAKIVSLEHLTVDALISQQVVGRSHCQGCPVSIRWDVADEGGNRQTRRLDGVVESVDPQWLPGGYRRIHVDVANQLIGIGHDGIADWMLYPGQDIRMTVAVMSPTLHPSTPDPLGTVSSASIPLTGQPAVRRGTMPSRASLQAEIRLSRHRRSSEILR